MDQHAMRWGIIWHTDIQQALFSFQICIETIGGAWGKEGGVIALLPDLFKFNIIKQQ